MADNETVEIPVAQLRTLQAAYELANQLHTNPKSRRTFERLVKDTINPNAITSDDAAAPFIEPLQNEVKELKGKLKEITDSQIDREFNETFSKVSKKFSLTEDGEKALKEFMVKKQIADPEDAVLAWKGRQPVEPARPTGMSPTGWDFGELETKDETNEMLNDTDGWADRRAAKIWNEVRAENEAA